MTEDLDVAEGKVLTREGDLGREFFVIVEGDVSVTKGGEEIRRLGPGDFFGEIALVYESPRRTATVTISAPLAWFPRLLHATPAQRANWELIGDGHGVLAGRERGALPTWVTLAAYEPRQFSRVPGDCCRVQGVLHEALDEHGYPSAIGAFW